MLIKTKIKDKDLHNWTPFKNEILVWVYFYILQNLKTYRDGDD